MRSSRAMLAAATALCGLAAAPLAAAAPSKPERASALAPLPRLRSLAAGGWKEPLLVEFKRSPSGRAWERRAALAGAREISSSLQIRLFSGASARRFLPAALAAAAVAGIQRDAPLAARHTLAYSDPLYDQEWWRAQVGADQLGAGPAPAVPVSVIDTGVDAAHPEFQGAQIVPLNAQLLTDSADDFHGTAVASVAAAPANRVGMVGIWPRAAVWAWDAHDLSDSNVIAGIDTAVRRGVSVINMSLGSTDEDPLLEQECLVAFRAGSLLVAAAGNEFEQGNPAEYPASFAHVLTVAATDENRQPTSFSNVNDAVDLSAPGQDIVAAEPFAFNPAGWEVLDGTSFAAPIVSAAAAWVWSVRRSLDVTQLFDLLRFSAGDIASAGFDSSTGFGLVDLPSALAHQAPPPDPSEPNDDVYMVKRNGLFASAAPPLTRPGHGSSTTRARLDHTEDPEDVYRVWVPPRRTVKLHLQGADDVNLEAWRAGTGTVLETSAAQRRDLIGSSQRKGRARDTLLVENRGRTGGYVYADVFLAKGVPNTAYTLKLSTLRQ